jgi:hypothetical protein
MRDYSTTPRQKLKIMAGAIAALVTVGLLAALALGFLWVPPT